MKRRDVASVIMLGAAGSAAWIFRRYRRPSKSGTSAENSSAVWVDAMRGVALTWIAANHIAERVFGYPLIANPSAEWPPLRKRVGQLRPIRGFGAWTIPFNIARYIGWAGDQGVQLYFILSGFGLTRSLLDRDPAVKLDLPSFYRRRAARIYPHWIGAHLLFTPLALLAGKLKPDWRFPVSALGIRCLPKTMYYLSPAWWYVGSQLQLYALYPVLWGLLRKRGPAKTLALGTLAGWSALALGGTAFRRYRDLWMRGAFAVTRLPEFAFGMAFATWHYRQPMEVDRILRDPKTTVSALGTYALGTALSLTLLGMSLAPSLLGVSAFAICYGALGRIRHDGPLVSILRWIGRHSYSLSLVHHPLVLVLVPAGLEDRKRTTLGSTAAVAGSLCAALLLEMATSSAQRTVEDWSTRLGTVRTVRRLLLLASCSIGFPVVGELAMRRFDPQEALGWGERPSLQPHPSFGWNLKPLQTTRLRWESYDYTVTANALGFPGTQYPQERKPNSLRIMTLGDAFTSAEGVDTDRSWPRQLERELTDRLDGVTVEVLNFGITGYGPQHYAAVAQAFAPSYRPDTIVIGMSAVDFQEVFDTDEAFCASIGFDLPSPYGPAAVLRLLHLSRWLRLTVLSPLVQIIRKKTTSHGYFLGNFYALERNHPEADAEAIAKIEACYLQIANGAREIGAQLILALVPAPVQVCDARHLAYYPKHAALGDESRFDLELPQRMACRIAQRLGFPFVDLRAALHVEGGQAPYQARNMHFTELGHRQVARYIADELTARALNCARREGARAIGPADC